MRQLEIIDGVCVRAIVCEAANLPATDGAWIHSETEGGPRWKYDGNVWTEPDSRNSLAEPIISVREFTTMIGVGAMKAIREKAKTDDDYGTLWDLGKMTGDVDRSSPSMPVVLDDLLAAGEITQEQYDLAYPPEFRPET